MKPRIKIENVGPITSVDLEINKVNVFIGPQSIGKSTLAKIISFCAWLEKNILMNQGATHVNQDFLQKNLLVYHKLKNFFNETSLIEYSGNLISFTFRSVDDFNIEVTGSLNNTDMRKITYIPAERNIITIPNISTLALEDNYVRDFIFDWLLIRDKFTTKNQVGLLGLGGSYSFDANKGDVVTLDNGKEIPLNQSSSGLQSVVPLLVFIAYGAEWIFHNAPDMSFDNFKAMQKAIVKNINSDDIALSDAEIQTILSSEKIQNSLTNMIQLARQKPKDFETDGNLKRFVDLVEHIGRPHSSFFVIEEPEENLFPKTQYELVKYIFKMLDNGNDNTIVITTHSPYILTSINNLIQAQNAFDDKGVTKEEVSKILKTDSFISFSDINAVAFADGKFVSMKDDEFKVISATSLDDVSDIINADFEKLLDL